MLSRRAVEETPPADCEDESRRRFVALDDPIGLSFLADPTTLSHR
jgi:hypothetical protein